MNRLAAMALILLFTNAGHAGESPAARLQVQVAASEAPSKGKSLYMRAAGTGLAQGTHQIRYAVFDANGKEVMTHTTDITADSSGKWRHRLTRGLRPSDSPGTWWVTLEVAGQPLANASLKVAQ